MERKTYVEQPQPTTSMRSNGSGNSGECQLSIVIAILDIWGLPPPPPPSNPRLSNERRRWPLEVLKPKGGWGFVVKVPPFGFV